LADRIHGGINGLIYLPRSRLRKPFGEVTMADLLDDVAVTVGGLMLVAQALSSGFGRRFEQDPRADSFVISISSVLASQVSMAESLTYHTAKAAQEQLVRYLAVKLGCWGVRANAVAPGWIAKTRPEMGGAPFSEAVQRAHPLMRTGNLEDVTNAVVYLASPSARFITGQVLHVDGGISLREAGSLAVDIAGAREC
jgi:NAD(P)-dependent dehydrogenase (short-subunit alcohol dehydrogenase family)